MSDTTADAPTIEVRGLPAECPHCDLPAGQVTGWLLGMHGLSLQVVCPRCFTAVAPVRGVAAKES